ncbi:MAG: tyrosine-type recombinase/integrase [Steroidobacteraceae bacterium]
MSGIETGALWRRVRRAGATTPLSAVAVYEIIVKRARQAGITGAIMAHSLRAGFVTEALKRKHELFEVMALTGHQSAQTVKGYHRPDTLEDSSAAKLLK